jgi:hypothetical protein
MEAIKRYLVQDKNPCALALKSFFKVLAHETTRHHPLDLQSSNGGIDRKARSSHRTHAARHLWRAADSVVNLNW